MYVCNDRWIAGTACDGCHPRVLQCVYPQAEDQAEADFQAEYNATFVGDDQPRKKRRGFTD